MITAMAPGFHSGSRRPSVISSSFAADGFYARNCIYAGGTDELATVESSAAVALQVRLSLFNRES
jgi:hypothetical protein